MYETDADLQTLQALLSQSIERAGAFLRSSFQMPEHSLDAQQLVNLLDGMPTVVFSTVTSKGEPRTAPISAIFYRGAFHIPTVAASLRARHVRKQPAVSLSLYEGNDVAVIAHGRATVVAAGSADFAPLDEIQRAVLGTSTTEWGDGIFLRVEAERLYSFVRYPERF